MGRDERKRGRPSKGTSQKTIGVRMPEEMVERIDAYLEQLYDDHRIRVGRGEIIRKFIEEGLTNQGLPKEKKP